MTERVTHAELLSFRRELLESIPLALRERLNDIDHLLGWPEFEDVVGRVQQLTAAYADLQAHQPPAGIQAKALRLSERVNELEQALGDLWGAAKRVVEREHVDNADGVTWMGLLHNQTEAGRAILAKGLG